MGFLDLSTSAASKKHVDFNDARYQLADKLKWNGKQAVRSSFTLYDNKEENKVAVQDIAAAYALSDKKLHVGELLNKLLDLILDLEDGVLDTEKDAIYTWKYANTLLDMYEDKARRQELLTAFDNSLKTSLINSQTFMKRYPGKYVHRTNFFDPKVKSAVVEDIVATFKEEARDKIHQIAIKQSKTVAEAHSNPILDRIVMWAVENYQCEVDSFYETKEDQNSGLFYAQNTIILHLNNGYDMSIIGYVGTEHDDKFAISILDAHNIAMTHHAERIDQRKLKNTLSEASNRDNVDPLTKLLKLEKKKNAILKQQHDILTEIRPMISADVLSLKAAESVVGADYIWGCEQYRKNHEDLPADFKIEDIKLPMYDEDALIKAALESQNGGAAEIDIDAIADTMSVKQVTAKAIQDAAQNFIAGSVTNDKNNEETAKGLTEKSVEDAAPIILPFVNKVVDEAEEVEEKVKEVAKAEESEKTEMIKEEDEEEVTSESAADADTSLKTPIDLFADIEDPKKKVVEKKKFGENKPDEFHMPSLTINNDSTPQQVGVPAKQMKSDYDPAATLLPGFTPPKPQKEEENIPSATQNAKPMPIFDDVELQLPVIDTGISQNKEKEIKEKAVEKHGEEEKVAPKKPKLSFESMDDLFS